MTPVRSILVPLDGSVRSAEALSCVHWLAERLGADVHVLGAGDSGVPVQQALERLHVPRSCWHTLTLHSSDEAPEQALLDAVRRYDIDLIIMTARGSGADRQGPTDPPSELGHVTRWVVERSPVPVLVMPPRYRERLPWHRALIPVSGEPEADEALALGVGLSNGLGLEAIVVHVLDHHDDPTGLAAQARYADAPHYEYPGRLQELLARALPGCTAGEAGCIADVVLCRGDVARTLLDLVEARHIDVVVVGWHGTLHRAHADIVRAVLRQARCPVLLVKARPPRPFALKVGAALE